MKKNSPQIRFNGYEGEWEEVELENIAKIIDGDRGINYPSENDFSLEGHTIFLSATNVTKQGFSFSNVQYISEQKSNSMGKGKVSKNDLILTSRGSIGHIAYYDNEIFNQYPNLRINSGMLIIRVGKEHSGNFILQNLTSSKGSKNIKQISFGSAQPQLTKKDVSKLKLYKTNLSEQQAIGSFFKELDDIISLKKRELELLKEQKKGFLQKMFPKKGETVPEIRFAGFADDWEQRKLGEISEKVTLKNKDNTFDETLTNSAEFGIISQNDFFDKEISNRSNLNGYYVVENNNFVYNPRISNFAPVGPIKRNKLGRTGVMSPLYYVFKTRNIDNDFLEKYFDTTYWHIFMKLNGDSGARADRFAIKDSVFKEMPIPFPKIEEQIKIGNFFKQLDDTIALHQRKLDLLKEQKKGFLQKMFV